jgi:hypothetical protein
VYFCGYQFNLQAIQTRAGIGNRVSGDKNHDEDYGEDSGNIKAGLSPR